METDVTKLLDKAMTGQLSAAEQIVLGEQAKDAFAAADQHGASDELESAIDRAVKAALAALPAVRTIAPVDAPIINHPLNVHRQYSDLLRAIKNGATLEQLREKSLTEGTDADGGVLVPTQVMAEIARYLGEYGVGRRNARVTPVGASSIVLITRDSGMSAYYTSYNNPAATTNIKIGGELTAVTNSKPQYSQVKLVAATLATLSDPISNELLSDSSVDLYNEIALESMEAIAIAEDGTIFNGDGTATYGGFTGVLQHTSVNEVEFAGQIAQLDYGSLIKMTRKVPSQRMTGAKWYMHRNVMSVIDQMTDGQDRLIYRPNLVAGDPATLLGYPVELCETMPGDPGTGACPIVLGNLNNVTLYDLQTVRTAVASVGTVDSINLFTQQASAVLHSMRHMIVVRRPLSLVRLKLAA